MENAEDKIKEAVDEIDAVIKDVVTNVNKVTGILSGALGGLPFKVGIFIVALYQLLYISYKAFLETRTDNVIREDCYCAERDQIVYRTMTFTLMGAWILYLPILMAFIRVLIMLHALSVFAVKLNHIKTVTRL